MSFVSLAIDSSSLYNLGISLLTYCRNSNEQKYLVGFFPSSIQLARVLICMPSILLQFYFQLWPSLAYMCTKVT